ncbi:hypothetical protein GQ53DRAFT_746575 [Thozetella sp. PMI_491]|nr:hypothetical protein GQ53DRAFT_746575 [Thozetella sp. PMI_491]
MSGTDSPATTPRTDSGGHHATNQMRHARIYDLFLKNASWVQAVNGLTYDYGPPPPVVGLLGYDLVKAYYDLQLPSFLALVISDWGGDVHYMRERLFASFRDQDYDFDEASCEVTFKKSGLVLHIGDAIGCNEWIRMRDPGRLFHYREGKPQTAVLYSHDDSLHEIGLDRIGGVEGFSGREYVQYVSSVRLQFGNGMPVYRVVEALDYKIPSRLVSKRTKTGEKREWVTGWRLARAEEQAWSFV